MNLSDFLAREELRETLDRRIESDDAALHEAFQLAAEHHENDGADRLRAWAIERHES